MTTEEDVVADYEESLSELVQNSKPIINVLTMLAKDYIPHASKIVQVIETHLQKVPTNQKLYTIYLIDSIVKNTLVESPVYRDLFNKDLVKLFVQVFEKADEETRAKLFKVRSLWVGIFSPSKLYAIDIKVHAIDPAWPIQEPSETTTVNSNPGKVHLNPAFFNKNNQPRPVDAGRSSNGSTNVANLEARQRELQMLEQRKRELLEDELRRQNAKRSQSGGSHVQLQSVVTIPAPQQNSRDPRLSRVNNSVQQQRPSTSSTSGGGRRNTDNGSGRSGSADMNADRRPDHRSQQIFHDVDLRAKSSTPSLPPKKRKPQSPAIDSEPDSPAKEKRRRSDVAVKQEIGFPFGTTEDQDLRFSYRNQQPPASKVKQEIVDEESTPAALIPGFGEKLSQRPTSPGTQEIFAAITAASSSNVRSPQPDFTTSFGLTSAATVSSSTNVRISIDAPELPDRSLGALMAHRDTILQRTEQQLADGQISQQQFNDIMRDFMAVDEARFGRSKVTTTTQIWQPESNMEAAIAAAETAAQMRPSISAPVIGSNVATINQVLPASAREPTGMDPIPANNRIFVDGRAYEVRYIEDVAVIERNGLPHRIYFVGTPRDVVVDGYAHTLSFGETKSITIDGQPHVVRFGAPSKELYMGPFPFRGSFGGPPIRATINGVPHKIQLCGPPPEVKIDPEPAHELLRYIKESHMPRSGLSAYDYGQQQAAPSRRPVLVPSGPISKSQPTQSTATFLSQSQQPSSTYPPTQRMFDNQFPQRPPFMPIQTQPTTSSQQQPNIDVMDLYAKLVGTGIIMNKQQQQLQQEPPVQRTVTPPIPSANRFGDDEVVEQRQSEPDLKDFAPGAMKVRYKSVIDALYQQKMQCSTCGMRFPDGDRLKYSKHLDWHFKQGRRDKDRSSIRPWYLNVDDWIRFEEVADENAPKAKSTVFENAQKDQQRVDDSGRVMVVSTDSVIPASDDNQECAVCGEKFEQFWDEDEEVWKMRNATMIRGKAYHPLCYQDVSSVDGEPEVLPPPSFAPLPEDFMASNSSGDEGKNIE